MGATTGLLPYRPRNAAQPVVASPLPQSAPAANGAPRNSTTADPPPGREAVSPSETAPTALDWLRYFALEVRKLAYTISAGAGEHALLQLSEQMTARANESCVVSEGSPPRR
ncbi:hypothetical protein LAUMK40_05734 [Mycobacterium kansasii]|uniref:hypothetical protein n=1 Tax=Mycobacterium kansasii TaxID=1768 RepID=UPI000F04253B|nr:hypothetical protein [Mycobacterium kansasii]VAZ69571.1 hypothetical protein LAUMK40_05734 [Mycobacterium kansasii]